MHYRPLLSSPYSHPLHELARTPLATPDLAWGARLAAAKKDSEAPSDGPAQDCEPGHWGCRRGRGS